MGSPVLKRRGVIPEDDSRIVLRDDADAASVEYLQRMSSWIRRRDVNLRVSLSWVRPYWFDALVVVGAIAGALEIAAGRNDSDAPDLPLALIMPIEAALTLVLLARRRFPFAAPAGMLVAGAALSFIDGRLIPYTAASFLAALAACFLLGILSERRQAVLGLAIAVAAVLIIVGNDPETAGGDYIFIPLLFTAVWLSALGFGRKLEQAREA